METHFLRKVIDELPNDAELGAYIRKEINRNRCYHTSGFIIYEEEGLSHGNWDLSIKMCKKCREILECKRIF